MIKETEILLKKHYCISNTILEALENVQRDVEVIFDRIDEIREFNQYKVLNAMQAAKVSDYHFNTSTGYGYSDLGRDTLEDVYAKVFRAEKALVRPQIISGTHALTLALFGVLRPGDELISATGSPYDTLKAVIGNGKKDKSGSLCDWGISYKEAALASDGIPNIDTIINEITHKTKMVLIQRSRGYSWRPSLTLNSIKEIIDNIKTINNDIIVLVDNCYGEFVEEKEPIEVGADIIAGSLIKNPGGGLAPTGGYIAGKKELVDMIANRLTAPGLGDKCGPSLGINHLLYVGLFNSPHIVGEALKTAVFSSRLLNLFGFEVSPEFQEKRGDIIQAVKLNTPENLLAFCRGIQKAAPVDSHVMPEPSPMPGYEDEIIMAGGTFIQGSSIELSVDAPIRPPYIAYFQGGFNWHHGKLGVLIALNELLKLDDEHAGNR